MKTKTIFPIVLLAGIVAFGVVAWRWAEETRRAREATAKVDVQRQRLRLEGEQLEARLATVMREQAAANATLDALKRVPVVAPAKSASVPTRRLPSILALIRNSPDAEAYYLEYKRAQLAARYGPLFRTLGLSAEAVAKFQNIYIRREEARMDLENVLGTQGSDSAAAVEKLRAAAEAEYSEAQRALLGATGYAQLQEYENVAWWRATVSAIAGVAAVEHVPLSAPQADELVNAFRASDLRRGAVDWAAFETRARAILTPAQLEVVNTMDPGPTRGGLLQSRLYAAVEIAKRDEEKQSVPAGAVGTKPEG